MFALQGNHPQAAVEYAVKSPHLFLGVYQLFYHFCPSSTETSSTTIKLFLIPALCLLLFDSAKTQMLMYKYITILYSFFSCERELGKSPTIQRGVRFPNIQGNVCLTLLFFLGSLNG